jgi:predicted DCC family thiol-disulfide oxidoreductase YuxK
VASATVLYDGDCGLCRWTVDKLLWWDRRRRLREVALQDPEAARLLPGMDDDERMGSFHLVGSDGSVVSGAPAIPAVLRLVPLGRPLAAVADAAPGLTARGYRWVTEHRLRLSRLLRLEACRIEPSRRR